VKIFSEHGINPEASYESGAILIDRRRKENVALDARGGVPGSTESALSGRLKIAQRFIAGNRPSRAEPKSVKRTAEKIKGSGGY
jgi:hypothetical protein